MRWAVLAGMVFWMVYVAWSLVGSPARSATEDPAALLVRAPDGRCWRARGRIKHEDDALSWRTDGGPRVRVAGADWVEVVRGDGVNAGLGWRAAAVALGVDLGACLPAAERKANQ